MWSQQYVSNFWIFQWHRSDYFFFKKSIFGSPTFFFALALFTLNPAHDLEVILKEWEVFVSSPSLTRSGHNRYLHNNFNSSRELTLMNLLFFFMYDQYITFIHKY
jgi:hypothetical protein